MHCQIRKKRK